MMKAYHNSKCGRVVSTLLLIIGILSVWASPVWANKVCPDVCESPLTREIHTYDPGDTTEITSPIPDFCACPTEACDSLLVYFYDWSQGYIDEWNWDFGDPGSGSANSATGEYPTHYYTTPGVYSVTLTVTGPGGTESITKDQYITIKTSPTADFIIASQTNSCEDLTVTFENHSTGADTWTWEFGDGNSSGDLNPTHTYTSPGSYHVTLTVQNDCGYDSKIFEIYVGLGELPIADFRSEITQECDIATVTFEDMSQYATSWDWDFGDGTTSTDRNPVHIYTTAGVYTVTLRVTNDCGEDTATKDEYITVYAAPIADFSASPIELCIGTPVNFADLSQNAATWYWEFGDGDTSTLQNPSHVYPGAGLYSVRLTVTNECGRNFIKKSLYIKVYDPPIADFNYETTGECEGGEATFTNLSVHATSYLWEFGDGVTSTDVNPVHQYAVSGTYTVTLTASNICGDDSISKELTIDMGLPPTADFEADPTEHCFETDVQFTDLSTGADRWHWDFGDGQTSPEQNPEHTYGTPGIYTVKLRVGNDCGVDSLIKTDYITVHPLPIADFRSTPNMICDLDSTVTFTNMSQFADRYEWDFGDGSPLSTDEHPTHTYSSPGSYDVRLTAFNDCGQDTEIKFSHIVVYEYPIADFIADSTEICLGSEIAFTDLSQNAVEWHWDFGDGSTSPDQNPTHTYHNPGYYDVSLTVTNPCGPDTEVKTQYIYVKHLPVANFESRQEGNCDEVTFYFTDLSSYADSWDWDFGNGQSSSDQNPSMTYTHYGYYDVTLIASNDCGADTITNEIYVSTGYPPEADFGVEFPYGCVNQAIQFYNYSSTGLTSWVWYFGDGDSSTAYEPTHSYSASGYYTVSLTVKNECGEDTETKTDYIYIAPDPEGDFTAKPTEGCAPLTVQFIDHSTNALYWYWKFGDGDEDYISDPVHTYDTPGTYTVEMYAANTCGTDDPVRTTITVHGDPLADFTSDVTGVCVDSLVRFTDLSSDADTWDWDFGDGQTSDIQNPTHSYADTGYYTVVLTVTNDCGGDDESRTDYIHVTEAPTADFYADRTEICQGEMVHFTNLSTDADSWDWDFGDGGTSGSLDPSHTYTTPGVYDVKLTVSNGCGDDDEYKELYIRVYENPVADFDSEKDEYCDSTVVNFTDLSSYASAWNWDFGDGNTSTDQNPSHVYKVEGNYRVTQIVSNSCGSDTATGVEHITLGKYPIADFTSEVTEVCIGEDVYFMNQSQYYTSIEWDFGDGTPTSSDEYPTHTYSTAGTYTITLIAVNDCGADTLTRLNYVTVNDGPTADFSGTPTSGNKPLTVRFTDQSTSDLGITSRHWDFGDGFTSIETNPTHIYNDTGTFTVELIVVDPCGADTATKLEYVTVTDSCSADFWVEVNEGCAPLTAYFGGFVNGSCQVDSWIWDFGDPSSGNDNTDTGQTVDHIYNNAGTYTVTMTAISGTDTMTVVKTDVITVYDGPDADFTVSESSGIAPLMIYFTDQSISNRPILSWVWDFGDPTSGSANASALQNPSHVYYTEGTYTISLIVENECGKDTTYTDITIAPAVKVIKAVDKANAFPGEELLYTLTVQNNSLEPIYDIQVIDTIPDSTMCILSSITGNGNYESRMDLVWWDIPLLDPGTEVQLSFKVVLDSPFAPPPAAPTIISNYAIALLDNVDVAKVADVRTFVSNIVTTIIGPPTAAPEINKEVSATMASPGDPLTYTITVSNLSPVIMNNVVVYDAMPDSTTYIAGSATGGGIYTAAIDSIYWNVGTLNPSESRTLTFGTTIDADVVNGHIIPNTALVRSSSGANESNQVITMVRLQPLYITKTTDKPSGMLGDLIRFTIKIENYSNQPFANVQLLDTMPAGIFYVPGTSLLDGASIADPTGDNPYTWSLPGVLPASGTFKVEYAVLIGASAHPGMSENIARAEAYQGPVLVRSNRAVAPIYILGSTLTGSIRGKVIIDCDGDGVADMDTVPSGMDIYLDDGSQSNVNEKGMFYFSTVRAGERAVLLDERDLEGYFIPEEAQASVFVHVHETGESYVIFRICPEYPLLDISKKASIVPTVKVTKMAKLNSEQKNDTLGVLIDYEIDIKSNGLADPTQVRVVDSFPEKTRLILEEEQPLIPTQNGNQLVYEVTAAQEQLQKSVYYSLRDLEPGVRRFLTNKVHVEGDITQIGDETQTKTSEPAEVAVGPFLLAPPQDVNITLTPALFITSMADLQAPAIPQLEAVADSIDKYADADIKVEGHTDYRPIHTVQFPSNWELGEGRAKAVVDWLVENRQVDRDRLKYESFAATRPVVTTGSTSEELQPNRRTEVIIQTACPGFMAPDAIPTENWISSTSMALNPVRFDTLFEQVQTPLDIDFDDTWEIVLTVENSSNIAAENAILADVLPDGVEYIDNSATMDGQPVSVDISDKTLSLKLDRFGPKQKLELRYRIRALQDATPTGGGQATVEVKTSNNLPVVQKSNDVRFK